MKSPAKTAPKTSATSRKPARGRKAESAPRSNLWLYAIGALAASAAAWLAYAPALNGPFLFDDLTLPFNVPHFPEQSLRVWLAGVRPLLMLSYWINYQLSQLQTFSYHAFNLLLHAVNAVLVFLIVRKLLGSGAGILAVFAAGIFLLHPAQTESVAYVAGRSEALSATFFLAAFGVFLYRRRLEASWPLSFAVLGLFAAALLTKEHTAVFPALLLLTDYFWNPSFSWSGIRRNWRLYLLLAVSAAAGIVAVSRILHGADSAGFAIKDVPWPHYFFTQCRAFFVYLRLFLFPAGQTIDYDFPISRSILEPAVVFGVLGIVLLVGAAVYYRRRFPLACYGLLAFVILLAPTSSFVPLKDPIAEHRLYLPMVGLLLVTTDLLQRVKVERKILALALSAIVVVAAIATYHRNLVWADSTALWEDTVAKSPGKARAHFQLAYAYYEAGRCEQAILHYQSTAQLQAPDYRLLVDWALACDCLNKTDEALDKLRQAAAIDGTAHVHALRGMVNAKAGRTAEARDALETASRLDPNFAMTYVYRGNLYAMAKQFPEAAADYRKALALDPSLQVARDALTMAEANLHPRP